MFLCSTTTFANDKGVAKVIIMKGKVKAKLPNIPKTISEIEAVMQP